MSRSRSEIENMLLAEMVVEDLNNTLIESEILDDFITPNNTMGIFDDESSSYEGLDDDIYDDDYEDENLF